MIVVVHTDRVQRYNTHSEYSSMEYAQMSQFVLHISCYIMLLCCYSVCERSYAADVVNVYFDVGKRQNI